MARREREINIFNIAFLDVITGAMGAFVLLVVLLAPYVKKAQETPQQQQQQQEEDVQKTLDRAEQNMQQADQAMQTDDVEKLKRLLAQARADLAEARKELDALQQELAQAQQRLQQAEAENEDLRKRLQQAIAEADQARQQVVDLKDTLDHSAPVPTSWTLVDIRALPTCGSVKFLWDTSLILPNQMQLPAGLTPKEADQYGDRGATIVPFFPPDGDTPFHRQYFVPSPIAGARILFGMNALSPPPPGCQLMANVTSTAPNSNNGYDMTNTRDLTTAINDARPVLLFSLPASAGRGALPTPADISFWQKDQSTRPAAGAK